MKDIAQPMIILNLILKYTEKAAAFVRGPSEENCKSLVYVLSYVLWFMRPVISYRDSL